MKYLYDIQPERYAQDIHSSVQLKIPVDMNKVCEAFGIKIHNEDLANAEALLVVSNGNKSILINDRKISYVTRQRFTIAHEVGHLFIPWHNIRCACSNIGDFDIKDVTEREADIFASELLIPTQLLEPRLLSRGITLELIKTLAREYNVSLGAMTRKVASLSNDDYIILYSSRSGSILPQVKPESFNLTLRTNIVAGSAARELLNNRYSNESAKRIVSCNTWFDEDRTDIEIVEESLYQPNFNRVFTLLRIANEYDYFDAFFDR